MNPKIAIISAVYGQSDPIKPTFPQNGDVEFLMVTDDAGLAAGVVDPMGWKIIITGVVHGVSIEPMQSMEYQRKTEFLGLVRTEYLG